MADGIYSEYTWVSGDLISAARLQALESQWREAIAITPRVKSSSYAMTADDRITAAATITLPDATTVSGRAFRIKTTTTATVTVDSAGGTIDGQSSITLPIQYSSLDVVSDGTNWHCI
jgi:hypothetical protein